MPFHDQVRQTPSPSALRLVASVATMILMATPASGGAQSEKGLAIPALPATVPLFPLPDITLFPNVRQPLYIFETRYRAMVADVLAGDRVIGMVMLRPGYEADYQGSPPVYSIGCAGVIESVERLPDGRYNLVLLGIEKFRIVSEEAKGPYRLAHVEAIPETLRDEDRALLSLRRRRLVELLSAAPAALPAPDISNEEVVNALSQFLPIEPIDRQLLLEKEGALARAEALIRLIEGMRSAPPLPGPSAGLTNGGHENPL